MAIMIATRTLRDAPGGNATNVIAPAGSKVQVLDATTPPWTKVQLLDVRDQPTGWVSAKAVDPAATATVGPLDKALFAKECCRQAIYYGVNAHYLMAVADLRTNVTSDAIPNANGEIGPFALLPAEWAFFSARPEFQLDFQPSDITSWRLQCAVFATITVLAQNKIASLMANQPTPTELYFTQLFGSKAAIAGISDPSLQVDGLIKMISAADFSADGIDPARIIARSVPLLQGLSVKDAMNRIADKLQTTLNDSRPFLLAAGANTIDDVPTPANKDVKPGSQVPISPPDPNHAQINFNSPRIPTAHRDMAQLIATRFGAAGFNVIQQVAAIANAITESGLNPKAKLITPQESSYGLFQLNQKNGVGSGHPATELQDPERNIAIMIQYIKHNKGLTNFRQATGLRDAVTVFVKSFEQPANQTQEIASRLGIAQSLMA